MTLCEGIFPRRMTSEGIVDSKYEPFAYRFMLGAFRYWINIGPFHLFLFRYRNVQFDVPIGGRFVCLEYEYSDHNS